MFRIGAVICTLLLSVSIATPALAHLQLYRQGPESAGNPAVGDQMGRAVVSGDFNGDGYDDIAAGAPLDEEGLSPANSGRVVISWGSFHGITHDDAMIISPASLGASANVGFQFGWALEAADFDQDGYDDLAVGAPGSNLGLGGFDRGEVFILRGSPTGLDDWLRLDQTDLGLAAEGSDRFGHALVAANFDLDPAGYPELVVGSPGENGGEGIIVEFLNSGGVPGAGGGAWFDEAVLGGANGIHEFGYSLAAGDLVSTAAPDLAVGAPGYDVPGGIPLPDVGRVWVIPGVIGVGIVQTNATNVRAGDVDNGQIIARFGESLAAGLFRDAGGYESLAVGEPQRSVNGTTEQGRVVVFPGGATALDAGNAQILDAFSFGDVMVDNENFGSALAAGHFEADDGYEDLAIGGRNDAAMPGPIQSGQVFLIYGGSTGFSGTAYWDQYDLNEQPMAGDSLGWSICFGEFDGTNKGGLAAGAPGEQNLTGAVYVIAPWRQEYGLGCHRALVLDCEDSWIYSLKPFEQSWIASITKIMTVFIAAERMQLPPAHPNYFAPYDEYIADAWVSQNVPGSKYHFGLNERMAHIDMLYACLLRSGNDAAFAIGDAIYGDGDPTVTVPQFVAEMNARAASLGMNSTHFHNPAGLDNEPFGPDLGDHYSTLADYVKLCRAAMNHPLFAQIAGTTSHPITRHLMLGTTPVDIPWTIENIYTGVMTNMTTPMNGIKGGSTDCAQATGCFSAEDPGGNGIAIVNTFYTPFTISDDVYTPDAARLMQLGLAECGSILNINVGIWQQVVQMPSLLTEIGYRQGKSFEFFGKNDGDMTLTAYRNESGDDDAHTTTRISRFSEVRVAPLETVTFGTAPFELHEGICFTNMGSVPANLYFETSYGADAAFALQPGEKFVVPSYDGGAVVSDMSLDLWNESLDEAVVLAVDEFYAFHAIHPPDPVQWSVRVKRNGSIINDGMELLIEGADTDGMGGQVSMVMTESGVPVGIPIDTVQRSGASPLQLRSAQPNPFSGQTVFSFDLLRRGRVELEIFDLRGRSVRRFDALNLEAGRWTLPWDARDDAGREVSTGSYFYRVRLDGAPAGSGKMALVR